VTLIENLSARKISTHSVDRAIRDVTDVASITSAAWSDGGHAFYSISGNSFSWCWDSATGQWHERESYGLNRWKIRSVANFGGRLIAGDYTANKLYVMSNDYFDEAGQPLIMTVQTPPVHAFPDSLEFSSLYLDIIPGVGLISGPEHNVWPEAMVNWSDDGTHFAGGRRVQLGRAGQTIRSAATHRLGTTRKGAGRTFRVSASAAVARGLMAMAATAERVAT
jgi:hypothetical protein